LLAFLDVKYPELYTKIAEEKTLNDDIKALLEKSIGEFSATFEASA